MRSRVRNCRSFIIELKLLPQVIKAEAITMMDDVI